MWTKNLVEIDSRFHLEEKKMKLFRVDYMDDCDDDTYLTIGNSKEEVEERETNKLSSELSCFMGCWIFEIDEVDGHKIIVD